MRKIAFILGLIITVSLKAQQYPIPKGSTVDFLTGIFWDDTKFEDQTYTWIITNGYKGLTIEKTTETGKLSKILFKCGFQDTYESFPDFVDNAPNQIFYLDSLKPTGEYMTTIWEEDINTKYNIAKLLFVDNFDLRDGYYVTGRNYDVIYRKKFLPPYSFKVFNSEVWQDLMTHSKTDSRNYISEFLELDVRAVKSKVADVFSKPRYVVKRLPQGTVVRVLGVEQKGGLVPVEYYTDDTKVDTALMTASFLEKPLHATEPLVEASFSCEDVVDEMKVLICSDDYLGLLDIKLNTAYKKAKRHQPKKLLRSQRAWLKERNKVLKIKDPYEQKSTLQHLYQERIQFLDNWRG